jgi:hypothetical protein
VSSEIYSIRRGRQAIKKLPLLGPSLPGPIVKKRTKKHNLPREYALHRTSLRWQFKRYNFISGGRRKRYLAD